MDYRIETEKDYNFVMDEIAKLEMKLETLIHNTFMKPRISYYQKDFNKLFDSNCIDYRNYSRALYFYNNVMEEYKNRQKIDNKNKK